MEPPRGMCIRAIGGMSHGMREAPRESDVYKKKGNTPDESGFMASLFSGALVLTDLDDFISPSQACIKPVEAIKPPVFSASSSHQVAKIEIRVDDSGDYYEINSDTGSSSKLENATITLNDCLACAGCITSAETVLITQQSQADLYAILDRNKAHAGTSPSYKTIVISLSPQSRASFASKYNTSPTDTHAKLAWFFQKYLGVQYLFDTSFARHFALWESAREFVTRYRHSSSTSNARGSDAMMPMLASACPGWICYAEKTHSYILPYISTTKSPQQIMGSLVKDWLASHIEQEPSSIYHVSIMPCYDKKLEASRPDFYNDLYSTRDIDCVLTTGEVEKMFSNHGLTFESLETMPIEPSWTKSSVNPLGIPVLLGCEGTSSGGYLSYIFRYAARELFGVSLTPQDVEAGNASAGVVVKQGRNNDFWEVCLVQPQDANVRKIKPSTCCSSGSTLPPARGRRSTRQTAESDHHFVEVMACPSGCINGGGQLKPDLDVLNSNLASGAGKEWVMRAESIYRSINDGVQLPEANQEVQRLYREWLGGDDTEKAWNMLHTHYHAIEKFEVNALAVKW
ncbi:hypothetical protein SeMB42_g02853 [Synchytrium endobioticum]|uniref:Iron hydrogenase small subunit domain-containing protein n=1 Tax=Synchytrium endobioticum TaxID=286115 RepID=A0A507DB23_9FUNG|nr:hypothetical protein SeMB42_g02853 [Synchytrium endobioticum]